MSIFSKEQPTWWYTVVVHVQKTVVVPWYSSIQVTMYHGNTSQHSKKKKNPKIPLLLMRVQRTTQIYFYKHIIIIYIYSFGTDFAVKCIMAFCHVSHYRAEKSSSFFFLTTRGPYIVQLQVSYIPSTCIKYHSIKCGNQYITKKAAYQEVPQYFGYVDYYC